MPIHFAAVICHLCLWLPNLIVLHIFFGSVHISMLYMALGCQRPTLNWITSVVMHVYFSRLIFKRHLFSLHGPVLHSYHSSTLSMCIATPIYYCAKSKFWLDCTMSGSPLHIPCHNLLYLVSSTLSPTPPIKTAFCHSAMYQVFSTVPNSILDWSILGATKRIPCFMCR